MSSETKWPAALDNLAEGPTGSQRNDPSLASVINAIQRQIGITGSFNFGTAVGSISVLEFDIPHDAAGLDTGFQFGFTPTTGSMLWDWVVVPSTGNNGLTPKLDLGFFGGAGDSEIGALGTVGASPFNVGTSDDLMPGNPGFLYSPISLSWSSALQSLGFTTGPPVPRQQMPLVGGQPMAVVISQDGTAQSPVAATLTAAAAPTAFPYVVTQNSNDVFFHTGTDPVLGGGAATQERFAFATESGRGHPTFPISYANLADLELGMMAATGSLSDTFGQYVTVSDNGTKLVLTANPLNFGVHCPGAASNGNSLAPGTHDALNGLGFTGANVFAGGVGGSPGASAGEVKLMLAICEPFL